MSELCLHRGRARFTIDLHPSTAGDVLTGIREQLQQLLFKYNYDLKGIPLSYNNLSVTSLQAPVGSYFPYFKVTVMADILLFRPRVGSRLSGTVGTVGADYLGLLVLGLFNAVVGRERIPGHMRCRPTQGCWVSDVDRRLRLEVGTPVDFVVAQVHEEHDLFAISGSLLEPGTGVSAAVGNPTAALTAGLGAAAADDATAAALRAPYSTGPARADTSILLPDGKANVAPAGERSAAAPAARAAVNKQKSDATAPQGFWKAEQSVSASNGDRDGHARNGKDKKRKHRDGAAPQTAPVQPPASAVSQPTLTAATAAAASKDAAQEAAPRPHKKRRRDREQAIASNGPAPAMVGDVQSYQPQRFNGPVPSAVDGTSGKMQAASKLKRQEASADAVAAVQTAAELPDELEYEARAGKKKVKGQKSKGKQAAIAAAAGQLPNGIHRPAEGQPRATASVATALAGAVAGKGALQNGVIPHQDALPRTKHKTKRKKAAGGGLPASTDVA